MQLEYQMRRRFADWEQRCLLSAVVNLPFKIRAKCDPHWGRKVEAVV